MRSTKLADDKKWQFHTTKQCVKIGSKNALADRRRCGRQSVRGLDCEVTCPFPGQLLSVCSLTLHLAFRTNIQPLFLSHIYWVQIQCSFLPGCSGVMALLCTSGLPKQVLRSRIRGKGDNHVPGVCVNGYANLTLCLDASNPLLSCFHIQSKNHTLPTVYKVL